MTTSSDLHNLRLSSADGWQQLIFQMGDSRCSNGVELISFTLRISGDFWDSMLLECDHQFELTPHHDFLLPNLAIPMNRVVQLESKLTVKYLAALRRNRG